MSTRQSHNSVGGASERLYVWNLLSSIMSRVGVPMSTDDKALIVAGDEEVAMSVLEDLRMRLPAVPSSSSRRQGGDAGGYRDGRDGRNVRSSGGQKSDRGSRRSRGSKQRSSHGMQYGAHADSEMGAGGERVGLPDIGGGGGGGVGGYQNKSSAMPYQQQPSLYGAPPNGYMTDGGMQASFVPAQRGGGYGGGYQQQQQEAWGDYKNNNYQQQVHQAGGGGYQRDIGEGGRGYSGGGAQNSAMHHHASHPTSHRTPRNEPDPWGALPLNAAEPLMMMGKHSLSYGGGIGPGANGASGTCLEFLASSLSQHAGVSHQQASEMITEKGQHRMCEILIDGTSQSDSGAFLVAIHWLEAIFAGSQTLAKLLTSLDPGGLVLTLDTAHRGLTSPSKEVSLWSCRILSRIAFDLHATGAPTSTQIAYEWFAPRGDGGPLSAAIKASQTHPSVRAALFPVYEQFCKGRLRSFFTTDLPLRLKSEGEYSGFVSSCIESFAGAQGGKEALVGQGIVIYLVSHAVREATAASSGKARASALCLVVELWSSFPSDFPIACGNGGAPAWEAFRKAMLPDGSGGASHSQVSQLQMSSHSHLFRLLSAFIDIKSQNAAVAYKLVATSLLENYQAQELRIFILSSLGAILQENSRMPLALLIEPLMRHVRSDGYADEDFDFYLILARHPRLEPAQALMIIDVMTRIAMTDPASALTASVPLVELLSRFKEHSSVEDFVGRLGKLGMSIVANVDAHSGEMRNTSARKLAVLDVLLKVAETGYLPYQQQLRPSVESVVGAGVAEGMPPAIGNQVQRLWRIVSSDDVQQKQPKQQQVQRASEAKKENMRVQQQDNVRAQQQDVGQVQKQVQREGNVMRGASDKPIAADDSPAPAPAWKKERYNGVDRSQDDIVRMSDESSIDPSPQKVSAAERRAQNLARAKEQLEAKKQAILDARKKREGKDELPNFLTEEQVKARIGRKEVKREQVRRSNSGGVVDAGRPRSVIGREASDGAESAQSDSDDRMSLPDQHRRVSKPSVLVRPPSAKTRKREQEIADIRRKRLSRLAKADQEIEEQRKREKELFDKARKEVERRMAELKVKAPDPPTVLDDSAISAASAGSHQKSAAHSKPPPALPVPKFDLKSDAHPIAVNKFDVERHAYMWVRNPARKQNVEYVLTLMEELFSAVIGEKLKPAENMATRKAQMSKVRISQNPSHNESAAGVVESRLSQEEIDLLSKSAIGDDDHTKILKRQQLLKKKLAMYREERRRTEQEKEEEDSKLKSAMDEEKKREREAEERRRSKIKEKLARYKIKMEEDRAKKAEEEALKEKITKEERKRRITEYMKVKNEKDSKAPASVPLVPQPPAARKPRESLGVGKDVSPSPAKRGVAGKKDEKSKTAAQGEKEGSDHAKDGSKESVEGGEEK